MGCTSSGCCFGTSELSCFPKYMSDEMAFESPNFIWASPVSTTGTGFLRAEGLQAKELMLIMIKQIIESLVCLFLNSLIHPYRTSYFCGIWRHRRRIGFLSFIWWNIVVYIGGMNPTCHPMMWLWRSERSLAALASCSPSSSLSPRLLHPSVRGIYLAVCRAGKNLWKNKKTEGKAKTLTKGTWGKVKGMLVLLGEKAASIIIIIIILLLLSEPS